TRVQVGDGAQLTAGDEMHLVGNTTNTGTVNAYSLCQDGGGTGSANDSADDANPDNDLEVGGGQRGLRIGFHTGLTQIDIGTNSKLNADLVELKSNVAHTGGTSIGTAISVALGISDVDSLARVELYDAADVRIHTGAQITGRREVDMTSEVQSITSTTNANSDQQGNELG